MEEREFERSIEIGARNAEVIELVHNWCAHARIEQWGGIGLLEQQTGLPIGMRRVTCAHERASGQTSMRMAENALDFHDRNCVGCPHRQPVRLPNLTQMLQARDQRRAETAAAANARQRASVAEHERRAREIAVTRGELDAAVTSRNISEADAYAIRAVLDQLEVFDGAPTDQNAETLLESARAVPQAFTPAVFAHVLRIAERRGAHLRAMLSLANVLAPDSRELYLLALDAMACGVALDEASAHVTRLAGPQTAAGDVDHERIAPAAATAIWRARSYRPIAELPVRADPSAYGALWRAAPNVVEIATRRALRDPEKRLRRAGAFAVHALFAAGEHAGAMRHVNDLLAAFSMPDDSYDEGQASNAVAWVLGELLELDTTRVDAALKRAMEQGNAKERLGVLRTYTSVFSEYDDDGHRHRPGRAGGPARQGVVQGLALDRIIDIVSHLPDDHDLLREGVTALANRDDRLPIALLAPRVSALLGIAAMAVDAQVRPPAPILEDPRPSALRALEEDARRVGLSGAIDQLLEAVTSVAQEAPDERARIETIDSVLAMLSDLPESDEVLQARLVAILGDLPKDAIAATRVIPAVYTAMASASNLARARSSHAYAALCRRLGAENLPDLLHEGFLIHLHDPYLIVHRAAIAALRDVTLPPTYEAQARPLVWALVLAHGDAEQPDTLSLAIRVLLNLSRGPNALSQRSRVLLLALIKRLPSYLADDFITRNRGGFRGTPGYGELILDLLQRNETFDTSFDDLLRELGALGAPEIRRLADRIVEAGTHLMGREFWRVIECMRLLADSAAFEQAERLAAAAVAACGDTRAMLPRRLGMEEYQAIITIEAASARAVTTEAQTATRRLRDVRRAIASDREENEAARDLRLPS